MPNVKSQICFLTPKKLQPHYPLFVFLPGMDGTGQLLRSQTTGLEAKLDVRCLAIPPDDLTSWEVLTDKVIGLVEAELAKTKSPRQPVYLCGESFGGCLALKIVLQAPHLFDRMILVNPASSFNRRFLVQWGSQLVSWVPEPFYKLGSLGFLPFLASLDRLSPSDRRDLLEITQTVPQKTSVWRMSLLREFQLDFDQLRQIRQPTLLIASAADRLLPSLSEVRYLLQALPNAQAYVLPDSGHACLLETGVNLYDILRSQNFLVDVESNAPLALSAEYQ